MSETKNIYEQGHAKDAGLTLINVPFLHDYAGVFSLFMTNDFCEIEPESEVDGWTIYLTDRRMDDLFDG